jgi:hypothetical protein
MIPRQQTRRSLALVVATYLAITLLSACSKIELPYEPAITEGLTVLSDKTSISLDGLPIRFSLEVEDGGQFIRLNIFDQRFGSSNDGAKYVVKCRSVTYQPYLHIAFAPSPNPAQKDAANLEQCVSDDAVLNGKTRGVSILLGTGNFVGKTATGKDKYVKENTYAVLLPTIELPSPAGGQGVTPEAAPDNGLRNREAMLAALKIPATKQVTVVFTRKGYSTGGYH